MKEAKKYVVPSVKEQKAKVRVSILAGSVIKGHNIEYDNARERIAPAAMDFQNESVD